MIWPGKFERHTTSGVETRALTEGCDPLTLLYEPNHTHGLAWAIAAGAGTIFGISMSPL
jgi:hypothetical protein